MRIISGEFKGRRLLGPPGQVTRPITDRVKESLFNILFDRVAEARVADLFCGTGSMGLECLSRGAERVYLADRNRGALRALDENVRTLNAAEACEVWAGDILAGLAGRLARLEAPLDLVFLDPPYPLLKDWLADEAGLDPSVVRRIFAPLAAAMRPDGLAVLRSPRDVACPEHAGALTRVQRREYGTMALNFYAPAADSAAQPATQDAPPANAD